MLRKAAIAIIMFGLVGCASNNDAQPTNEQTAIQKNPLAHQYLGNYFSHVLNRVSTIKSDKQRDYTTFAPQAEMVVTRSPSMARKYGPLYNKLEKWISAGGDPSTLANYDIEAAQMGGGDNKGNVMFTGYYSPVIELRHTPNATFRYPVYAMPKCQGRCPSRAEIYNGALKGKGLELGYSKSMLDIFMMEVQGSGFVHYEDNDQLEYFGYNGKNGHRYVSIGRVLIDRGEVPKEKMSLKAIQEWVSTHSDTEVRELLEQNPSFVFFKPTKTLDVKGSAGIPLLANAAVAADRKYIPMGSALLAEVPELDAQGNWTGKHVLRLLLALDTGGAVKKNHLDLYHGMGKQAGTDAGHYKHFGRVWRLGLKNTATQDPWLKP
ncbi:putative membrane-bound lytic murein transglycosylase A [Photobacterium sp. SKA34]|uniref:murein transglycosylase A n=1 Tax=Photobacterium sp. SKA34 TaxID=121723 RepID=UPI00006B57D6|nr:murein transglycosylase A [Photobacterium sp. SKA34]EAR54433.1 putative membrane-bound lytic murein transglycosylase A [Photobacterium sp. SKA34]